MRNCPAGQPRDSELKSVSCKSKDQAAFSERKAIPTMVREQKIGGFVLLGELVASLRARDRHVGEPRGLHFVLGPEEPTVWRK